MADLSIRVVRGSTWEHLAVIAVIIFFTLSAWAQMQRPGEGRWQTFDPQSGPQFGRSAELRGSASVGGQPAAGATIRLQNPSNGMTVASAQTDMTGSFDLENLEPGTYILIADYGMQELQDRVSISPLQPPIEVRFAGNVPPGSGATVSAAQLQVPRKALDALQDARHELAGNHLKKAEKKLADALHIEPRFPAALAFRATLRLSGGDTGSALQDLDNAIHIDPHYPDAYFIMGAALNILQRFKDAARSLNQGIRLNPGAWQGHFEMGKALLGEGQPLAAIRELDSAAKSAPPKFASLHLVRGAALLRLERYDEGAAELQSYLKLDPQAQDAPQVKQTLAQIQDKLTPAAGGAQ